MSERLEEIKKWYEYNSNNDWEMMAFNKKHIKHLIEQAEIAHYFAKKNGELNEFLNEYSEVEHWGKNVIDVAMDIIRNQVERVEELEKEKNEYKNEIEYLKGTNEALEKDNQDKNDRIWNLYNNEMKVGE